MGLDMYLTRKVYVHNYDNDPKKGYYVTVTKDGKPCGIESAKITYVEEEIGYWRKANAIHKWFVDNVQGGKDDCGTYYLNADKLKQLADKCQEVLDKPGRANEILPVASGFFFGSMSYDEWYYDDLTQTIKICQEALGLLEQDKNSMVYYKSSW